MIVCRQCGKKKKVQRMPKHHTTWECSTCQKARAPKIPLTCWHCHKAIAIRPSKVRGYTYYICGHCIKVHGSTLLDSLRQPGHILVHDFYAAGEMHGFDIREPTEEEATGVERARHIRDLGLTQIQQERAEA